MNEFFNNLPNSIYWERSGDGLWAEPFNASSNIAFLIAAYLIYRLIKLKQSKSWKYFAMCILLAIVGIGSFSYHTARSNYTFLLDVVPIILFILLGSFLLMRLLIKSTKLSSILTASLAVSYLVIPSDKFNGSLPYILTLIVLLPLATWGLYKYKYGRKALLLFMLCLVFGIAIIFRSIDLIALPIFPMGTHWIWHILTALSAYILARFVITRT